jgi:hypothetical protein
MASEKKTKADPAPQKGIAPKKEAAKTESMSGAEPAKAEGTKAEAAKAEGGETAAAPASYSRGEGQKPVTQAYKDNWNAIFAKKKKR